jgi:hypothetical protein
VVWGVSAAVHAEPESALSAEAEEEFRPPAAASPAAADAVGDPEARDPLLPRRRPVTVLAGGAQCAVTLSDSSGEAREPGAIASRPDLNVLAQVLRGLQRMA